MSGRQQIADSLAAVTAGATPIHLLLTSEIEILSPASAHGIWAMADLIFRDDNPPAHSGAVGNVPPFTTMRCGGDPADAFDSSCPRWPASGSPPPPRGT
jgi:hypothetical protein